MRRIILSFIAVVLALSFAVPANAASHKHYGESARSVANEIGCQYPEKVRTAPFSNSAVDCMIGGQIGYLITFDSPAKQAKWEKIVQKEEGRNFYYASGKGAVVIDETGWKRIANAGAKALPGKIKHA